MPKPQTLTIIPSRMRPHSSSVSPSRQNTNTKKQTLNTFILIMTRSSYRVAHLIKEQVHASKAQDRAQSPDSSFFLFNHSMIHNSIKIDPQKRTHRIRLIYPSCFERDYLRRHKVPTLPGMDMLFLTPWEALWLSTTTFSSWCGFHTLLHFNCPLSAQFTFYLFLFMHF